MRRGCFFSVLTVLGLCIVACALAYFLALPKVRENARADVRDAISTSVAQQIPAPAGGAAAPGRYGITEDEIQTQIDQNIDVSNVNDFVIDITPAGLVFSIKTESNQDASYTGLPVAEDGQLRMRNMDSTDRFLEWVFPADDLGKAIEDAVNSYLAANGLRLESLELGDGEMTLVTAPAS